MLSCNIGGRERWLPHPVCVVTKTVSQFLESRFHFLKPDCSRLLLLLSPVRWVFEITVLVLESLAG